MVNQSVNEAVLQQYISSAALRDFLLRSKISMAPEQLRLLEKRLKAMWTLLPAFFPFKSNAIAKIQTILSEEMQLDIDAKTAILVYKDYRKIKRMRTSAQLAGRLGPRVFTNETLKKKKSVRQKTFEESCLNELQSLKNKGSHLLNLVAMGFVEKDRQILGNEIFSMTNILKKFSDHFSDDWANTNISIPLKTFFVDELFPFCYAPLKDEIGDKTKKLHETIERVSKNLESRIIDGKYYEPEAYRQHIMENVSAAEMIRMASEKNSRIDLKDIYISSDELQEMLKHELQDVAYYAIVQAVKIAEHTSDDQQVLENLLQTAYQNIQKFFSKAGVDRENAWDHEKIVAPLGEFHMHLKKLCESILSEDVDDVADKTNEIYAYVEQVIQAIQSHSIAVQDHEIYLSPEDYERASKKTTQ